MGNNANDSLKILKGFCENNIEIVNSGIIKGFDSIKGKVVLEKNGLKKEILAEELSQFDFDKFELIKPEKAIDNSGNLDVLVSEITVEEPIESLDETEIYEKIPTNLEEMKQCIASKKEKLIDQAIANSDFALDQTGQININKAINIVTDNSAENVIECIRDNKKLPTDLSAYDIKGKCVVEKEDFENNNVDNLINSSFNNILVYAEVAKLKNINFTEEQIRSAKDNYKKQVNNRMNVLGLNKKEEKVINFESKNKMALQLRPDMSIKKAGFADIIILTIIVLVYAAIIINLITKIN